MKRKITTIIFDFGDVLIQDKTKFLESTYNFEQLSPTKKNRYIKIFHLSEIGKRTTRELMETIRDTLVPHMSIREIKQYLLDNKILPPWKLALKLKKSGYKVIVFSNSQKTWPKRISDHLGMNLFQFPFVNSSKIGLRKPHQNSYQYLLKRYKINPREALFIDDRRKNLAPAELLGIKTFWYRQDYKALLSFLKKQKVKI